LACQVRKEKETTALIKKKNGRNRIKRIECSRSKLRKGENNNKKEEGKEI